jgi:ATP synthase protein I
MPKDQFKNRLEIAKKRILKKNQDNKNDNPSSIGTAFKLSTELVAAVAVGTIIGFIFDKTFGTKPWFILIFFFVGVVAGITNVIRSAKKHAKIEKFYGSKSYDPIQCL